MLGLVFLGIKYVEYHEKYEQHHVPGANFSIDDFVHPGRLSAKTALCRPTWREKTQVYLLALLRHDRHARPAHDHRHRHPVLAALSSVRRALIPTGYVRPIENFGLYWHFVDIVWIFLFPLLYLISRHPVH